MKTLGIAGGMGPLATALFYKRLTQLTYAASDAGHIECIIHSCPAIPDRTAFLMGVPDAENPAGKLIEVCRNLEKQADIIAIPCMTSHHFYDEVASSVSVPVLDMQRICAEYVHRAGTSVLGVISTQGTIVSGRLQRIFDEYGMKAILPIDSDIVTKLIYDVKAGKPLKQELFIYTVNELAGRDASMVLLGCTELQIYADDARPGDASGCMIPLLDCAELLAIRCIEECGGTVNQSCIRETIVLR